MIILMHLYTLGMVSIILLDKDYTKIRIDLIVDGHLYLRTYSKYYIVDYNLEKSCTKTLSLERHN